MTTQTRKKRGPSKLNAEMVATIKDNLRHGVEGQVLAAIYGVSEGAISLIKNGKRWQEVQ